jgi:UDP-glucose 4-epimerase
MSAFLMRFAILYSKFLLQLRFQRWKIVALRYFNPIGAHLSGKIGEHPKDVPKNLIPFMSQVAIGKLKVLKVFGSDYPTRDGTPIRDYSHVVDIAEGHVAALAAIGSKFSNGFNVFNLGNGGGFSVLEMIENFSKACGLNVRYEIAPRRQGDVAATCADPGKAARELGWKAKRGLKEMCEDSWRWQKNNPNGFAASSTEQ